MRSNPIFHSLFSALGLLLFTLPFFQTCSDADLRDIAFQRRVVIEPPTRSMETTPTASAPTKIQKKGVEITKQMRDESTMSAWEMGFTQWSTIQWEDLRALSFYTVICIIGMALLLLLEAGLALRRQWALMFRISWIYMGLLLAIPILLYLAHALKDYKQMRYGFYVLWIHAIAISIMTYRMQRTTNQPLD